MKSAQEFMNDLKVIVDDINKNESTISKAQLIQHQKHIRLIKKDVIDARQTSNAKYEIEKTNFHPGCFGIMIGSYGKAHAEHVRKVQSQKLQASNLYNQVIRQIDGAMAQIDEMKANHNFPAER